MDKIWKHISDKTQIDISIGDKDISSFGIESIEIEKEINRISRATVVVFDGVLEAGKAQYSNSDSPDFDPGQTIEIKAGYREGGKPEVIFKGIIIEHAIQKSNNRYGVRLIIKCKHEAYKMTIGRKVRYFDEKKKDSEVFEIITKDYKPLKSKVEATTYQHPKLVQYNCTDWDFILSRADVCGLVVIADDKELNIGKPKVKEAAKYEADGADFFDFSARLNGEHHHLKGFSGQVWDSTKEWKEKPEDGVLKKEGKANKDIKEQKLSEIKKQKEPILLPNVIPLAQEEVQSWADAALFKTQMSQIRGFATFYGTPINLGDVIELKGVGEKFSKEVYVTHVTHRIKNAEWKTTIKFGLSPEWYHESHSNNMNTPRAAGLLPPIFGIQLGVVTKLEGDPDGQSRIQVILPFTGTKDAKMELWARCIQPYASGEFGFFFMPEIGDEVLIGFLNDDPRFPIVLGSLYGKGQNKIPKGMEMKDANNNKVIMTRSGMKIEFFEKFEKGRKKDEKTEVEKKITIETSKGSSKGHRIMISEDAKGKKGSVKIENINDKVKNFILLDEKGITISSKEGKDITIEAKGNLNLKGKDINIEASGNLNLKAKETKNDAKLSVTKASSFKAGSFSGNVDITGKVDIK
ncbi:MAG: Rhs element Vgr protein [Maribacter sp.]|jgi:Rhs element Vgr protein